MFGVKRAPSPSVWFIGIGAYLFVATTGAGTGIAQKEPNCFAADAAANSGLRIFGMAPQPQTNDDPNYRHWPITDTISLQLPAMRSSRAERVSSYYNLWSNRCYDKSVGGSGCGWNAKGNYLFPKFDHNGVEVRPFFTTIAKADACTMAQAASVLGMGDARVTEYTQPAGLKVVKRMELSASMMKGDRFIDLCILPDGAMPARGRGISLDYEVQDGRSSKDTLDFLKRFASLVRRAEKETILFINPLDAPTQRYTSIDPKNAPEILAAFNNVVVALWSKNKQNDISQSFKSQIAVLKGERGDAPIDYSKLILQFELKGTTEADARIVREIGRANGIKNIMVWRNNAEVGGTCDRAENRKLSCLLFPDCKG